MNDEDSCTSVSVNEQTAKHLWKIGKHLSSTCPAVSRFYLFNLERKLRANSKLLENSSKRKFLYCNYCGNLWSPGNHKVRIQPPPNPNQHIRKLLKWEADKPWKLNNRQKRKLKKFTESSSKIVYTCFQCKKKVIFPGEKKSRKNQYFNLIHQNVPVPKVKYKKGDLNAGLFITSTTIKKAHELSSKSNSKPFNKGTSTHTHCSTSPVEATEDNLEAKEFTDISNKHSVTKSDVTLTSNQVRKSQAQQSARKSASILCYSTRKQKECNTKKQSESSKRKTLLAQILDQEQNCKKKPSIASFLVSL